jgi:hypothetical protein
MKINLILLIAIFFVLGLVLGVILTDDSLDTPVGLFVVRPDVNYFECAKVVHGNFVFYYDQENQKFVFDRDGKKCSVNTVPFRKKYIELYGKTSEMFMEDK